MKSGTESFSFADLKGEKGTLTIHLQSLSLVLHVIEEVVMIANDYKVQGLGVVAISSNVVNYPQDAPELMREFALKIILIFLICTMKHRKWPKPTTPPAPLTSFI
jgi:hypothetical protein